ncbi:hypothetical protein [Thermoproteus tenax]|uniref:Uncharacterized protein n=1 Tax=Thermoproteus tenax (strain ATCC 35583 / DSM 2078 / JCM 9277 / NBRC 100435 / Kra 1) TaxID=768679 RepID=G4RNA8_THETK|nr:hypothetical protein [Thermoproteus tenax]CCC81052.1 hypothetical protein TTX_0379 [Thermoproteus tenax Kra 1]
MADKFDRYYEYYSRRGRARTINLGLVKLSLGGRGASVEVRGIPWRFRGRPWGIGGGAPSLSNVVLEKVEGNDVALENATVQRVAGRRVKLTNCVVGRVEGEEVILINTHAEEVVMTRGRLVNSAVGVLKYREGYTAFNSIVVRPEKIADQRGSG